MFVDAIYEIKVDEKHKMAKHGNMLIYPLDLSDVTYPSSCVAGYACSTCSRVRLYKHPR
jgi:hypothetical protein